MTDYSKLSGDQLAGVIAKLQNGEVVDTHGDWDQFTLEVARVDQNIVEIVNEGGYKIKDILPIDGDKIKLVMMNNDGEF